MTISTTPVAPEVETIRLGDIKTAIAPLSIDGHGLEQLGFAPVAKEKASKLYRKSDLPKIITSIIAHLSNSATA